MIHKPLSELNPQKSKALKKLLLDSRVFTLSSSVRLGTCPLYFAYFDGALVFLSKADSNHIKHLSNPANASIYSDSKNLLSICGLQLLGEVKKANTMQKSAYIAKYPFISKLSFSEEFYAFCIIAAKLTNNALKDKIMFS